MSLDETGAEETVSGGESRPGEFPAADAFFPGALQDTLAHLRDVESAAQALVDDAQAEALRRVTESEKRFRERSGARYAARSAELEAEYAEKIAGINKSCQERLEEYRAELAAMQTGQDAFNRAVERFLAGED